VQLRPGGRAAPGAEPREYWYAKWSGTSFAAPRVAAEVANLRHRGYDIRSAAAEATAAFPVPEST